jgi:hypothetical protein
MGAGKPLVPVNQIVPGVEFENIAFTTEPTEKSRNRMGSALKRCDETEVRFIGSSANVSFFPPFPFKTLDYGYEDRRFFCPTIW